MISFDVANVVPRRSYSGARALHCVCVCQVDKQNVVSKHYNSGYGYGLINRIAGGLQDSNWKTYMSAPWCVEFEHDGGLRRID